MPKPAYDAIADIMEQTDREADTLREALRDTLREALRRLETERKQKDKR